MLIIVLCAILLLLAILILRAIMFGKKLSVSSVGSTVEYTDKAAEHLAEMIKIPTISSYNKDEMDESRFEKFRALLVRLYPCLHEKFPPMRIAHTGMLYHIKGKSNSEPTVLMAHYDVVPVDEAAWEHGPFCGDIINGELWGRGAIDTKITVMSVLEAVEASVANGFVPENDLYISFAGDEEVSGESAPAIVDYMEQNKIKPALVLDEGGAVVENVFPGVKSPIAVIGIGEKGMMNVILTADNGGGHASTPVLPSALARLGRVTNKIEKKGFSPEITKPVTELLKQVGPYSPLVLRIVFANMWLFSPLLKALSSKLGGELSAMMRTTTAFTMANASPQINVLPQKAKFGLNMRLINKDTPQTAEARLKELCKGDNVEVTVTHSQKASPYAQTEGKQWDIISNTVAETWGEAIVSPYLMIACSDSRHFSRICQNVYKFSAMSLSKEQRGLIHNNNERIPLETIDKCVEFYTRLIKKL